jgi:DNA-binding IscR family transcriptional regulator
VHDCPRKPCCATSAVWTEFLQLSMDYLEGITLDDLVQRSRVLNETVTADYVI